MRWLSCRTSATPSTQVPKGNNPKMGFRRWFSVNIRKQWETNFFALLSIKSLLSSSIAKILPSLIDGNLLLLWDIWQPQALLHLPKVSNDQSLGIWNLKTWIKQVFVFFDLDCIFLYVSKKQNSEAHLPYSNDWFVFISKAEQILRFNNSGTCLIRVYKLMVLAESDALEVASTICLKSGSYIGLDNSPVITSNPKSCVQ